MTQGMVRKHLPNARQPPGLDNATLTAYYHEMYFLVRRSTAVICIDRRRRRL